MFNSDARFTFWCWYFFFDRKIESDLNTFCHIQFIFKEFLGWKKNLSQTILFRIKVWDVFQFQSMRIKWYATNHTLWNTVSLPRSFVSFFVSTTWIPFGPENASNVAAKSDLAFDRRDILYFVSRMQVGDKELDSLITKSFSSQTFFVPFFFFFFFFPFLFLFSSFFW